MIGIAGSGGFQFASNQVDVTFGYEGGNVLVKSDPEKPVNIKLLFQLYNVVQNKALFTSETPDNVKNIISNQIKSTTDWKFVFKPSTNKHFTTSFSPVGESGFFTEVDTVIFCKNEMKGKGCAYIQRTKEKSPLLNENFNNINFGTLLEYTDPVLFKDNKFPRDMFFQSSASTIDDISDAVKANWYKNDMSKVIVNENKEDTENNIGGGIIPQSCFRYVYKKMVGKYHARMNLCPYETTYRLYIYDLKEKTLNDVLTLFKGAYEVRENGGLQQWLKEDSGKVMIHYIEISTTKASIHLMPYLSMDNSGSSEGAERKVVMNLDSGFKLNRRLPFSLLKESGIQIDISRQNGGISVRGSGTATFLGNEEDSYTISTTGSGSQLMSKITYEFKASSNRILMASLQEYPAANNGVWGSNEAGTEGNYLTTMESLKNISLNGAKMETFVGRMPEYK